MGPVNMKDVAKHANVSVATVDRVIHDRTGVSLKARKRVKEAIHELGFRKFPDVLVRNARGRLRFLFLLPKLDTGFVRMMVGAVERARIAVPDVEVLIDVQRVELVDNQEIVSRLQAVRKGTYDGIGLFAPDAPGVRTVIDDAVDRGIPVVTLVSDVPASRRLSFSGIDNVAAGRTAGRLMGRFLRGESGEIAIVTGNLNIRDHVEREMGFRQIIGAEYRDLKTITPVEGRNIAARNRSIVLDLLRDRPRLVGLYTIGGGNSGIISALEEMDPLRRPVTIVHEATPDVRKALATGRIDAAIGQDAGHIARSGVRRLAAYALGDDPNLEQERIRIDVYLAENLQ